MSFKSIHTTVGLAAMAAAEVSGIPINLTSRYIIWPSAHPATSQIKDLPANA